MNVSELLNQGVAIFVMCYFMWFNNTTMKEFRQVLSDNTQAINKIAALIEALNGGEENGDL